MWPTYGHLYITTARLRLSSWREIFKTFRDYTAPPTQRKFCRYAQKPTVPYRPPVTSPHLVDEGSEAVVEGLDLLLLVGADHLDVGVNLKVQGGQKAPVHGHGGDGGLTAHAAPEAHAHAAASAHAGVQAVDGGAGDAPEAPVASIGTLDVVAPAAADAAAARSAGVGAAAEVSRGAGTPHAVAAALVAGHSEIWRSLGRSDCNGSAWKCRQAEGKRPEWIEGRRTY